MCRSCDFDSFERSFMCMGSINSCTFFVDTEHLASCSEGFLEAFWIIDIG